MTALSTENKTKPGEYSLEEYMDSLSEKRRQEAEILIEMMNKISNETPILWGPSIIGFGSTHYKYESGREGDMPILGFSPRKTKLTIYFSEGFDRYMSHLSKLGKHKTSVSCLYINKLPDIDLGILEKMLTESYKLYTKKDLKPTNVAEYIDSIPNQAKEKFNELRKLIVEHNDKLVEVLSYGILGYRVGKGKIAFYISGWKDHLAIYPMPKESIYSKDLEPYLSGKATMKIDLKDELPKDLILKIIDYLVIKVS